MKYILPILFIGFSGLLYSQNYSGLDTIQPTAEFDNVYVQKIAEDSLQSSYVIWVKQNVKLHYHAEHTENLYVVEGKADMILGEELISIQKGDYINIPMGTKHSVTKVYGEKPLKVLSIQSPRFNAEDRIFIHEKKKNEDY